MKTRNRIQWIAGCTAAIALVLTPFVTACAQPASRPADVGDFQVIQPPQEGAENVVVDVNGETMTEKMVTEAAMDQIRSMTGGRPIPPQQLQMFLPRIRAQIIEQFITMTLLKSEAAALNIVADKADVDAAISEISTQLPDGVTLTDALKRQGMTEAELRDKIQEGVTARKVVDQKVPKDIAVSDQEIADHFAENGESMGTPASAQARHILFKVDAAAAAAAKAAVKAEAEAVRQQILGGADFAALAKEKSACPSGQKGGDLGKFRPGQMVPAFDKAVFSWKVGEMGPLVETDFGYHIIQVVAREDAKVPTLADVSDEIKETLSNQKRMAKIDAYIDGLREKAKITRPGALPAAP